jgi:hypothetical protein
MHTFKNECKNSFRQHTQQIVMISSTLFVNLDSLHLQRRCDCFSFVRPDGNSAYLLKTMILTRKQSIDRKKSNYNLKFEFELQNIFTLCISFHV